MNHPTSDVSEQAVVGAGTKVWARSHVREGAVIGDRCIVGEGVYVDTDVRIGNDVKIQNGALLYRKLTLADGVFVGPNVCFTNDKFPRAVTPDGKLKGNQDWSPGDTRVERGASIGAGALILPGIHIGEWAMVGAQALVTRDVPSHALVVGSPARRIGWVCPCGLKLVPAPVDGEGSWRCPRDGWQYTETP
jgi:UDP-2-acetamido-3-amino-2,3-dideoxy-glucuronate N-acetyltransferase